MLQMATGAVWPQQAPSLPPSPPCVQSLHFLSCEMGRATGRLSWKLLCIVFFLKKKCLVLQGSDKPRLQKCTSRFGFQAPTFGPFRPPGLVWILLVTVERQNTVLIQHVAHGLPHSIVRSQVSKSSSFAGIYFTCKI